MEPPTEIFQGQYIIFNGYSFMVMALVIDTDATPKLILRSTIDVVNANTPYDED